MFFPITFFGVALGGCNKTISVSVTRTLKRANREAFECH